MKKKEKLSIKENFVIDTFWGNGRTNNGKNDKWGKWKPKKDIQKKISLITQREKLEQFSNENWEFVSSLGPTGNEESSYPYGRKNKCDNLQDFNYLISIFFDDIIWTFILESWNKRMEEAKRTGTGTRKGQIPRKSTVKCLSNFEIAEVNEMFASYDLDWEEWLKKHMRKSSRCTKIWPFQVGTKSNGFFIFWDSVMGVGSSSCWWINRKDNALYLECRTICCGGWNNNSRFIKEFNFKSPKKKKMSQSKSLREDLAPDVEMKGKPHEHGILIYGLVCKIKKNRHSIFLGVNIIINPFNRSPMLSMFELLNM